MHTRLKSKLAIAGVCLLALLACSASSAFAARPHEFSSTFGEPCIAEPCEGASLKEPNGVAVNEATGDIYVVDSGANRVVRFDREGTFQSEFNGSGLLAGEEHAAGSLGRPGEVETGRFEVPETIAVDNSCVLRELSGAQCQAADPSNGDVYVVDTGGSGEHRFEHRVVDKYSPDGEYLGQISEANGVSFKGEPLDGVAVQIDGSVAVLQEGLAISEFSNTTPNEFTATIQLHGFTDFAFPGFAVDAEGDFYVRHGEEGHTRIAKVDSSGEVIREELLAEESTAVAADQRSGEIPIDMGKNVAVLNGEASVVERLGQEGGREHLIQGAGVGVDAAAGVIYAADSAAGELVVFGPAQPSAPKVEGESVENVTSSSAKLQAQINPRSEAGEAPTEYQFQYGRCASASDCSASGYEASAPVPEAKLAADFEVHGVEVEVEGLQPGATYHFRALAKNSHGEGQPGEERTFTTQSAGGTLKLPDDRGWELVSPPDKLGSRIEPISETGVIQAAAGGGAITYLANAPTEAEPQGYSNTVQVLSSRGAGAWSSRDIAIPHAAATGYAIGSGPEYKLFSAELDQSLVQPFGPFNAALSPQASESSAYLHELTGACGEDCFQPLVTGKAGFANVPEGTQFGEAGVCEPKAQGVASVVCGPRVLGASDDLSHVVLSSNAALRSGAGTGQLYEWAGGALSQVSILPNGGPSPASSSALGFGESSAARGAIAAGGARIVWNTPTGLYLRDMARGETVQLDQAEAGCGACESGGGQFQVASAEGSRVLFTDRKALSEDSGAGEGKADLYACEIAIQANKLACELEDLTPKRGAEGANVQGSLLGASSDATYAYFVAKGALSEAANSRGQKAAAGAFNLYERHGQGTSFIAALGKGDNHDWAETLSGQPTRVSGDGRYLELMSEASLTGYDNRERTTEQPVAEVYQYDASSGKLRCASCEPTGVRPVGVEYRKLEAGGGGLAGGTNVWERSAPVAANVPGWTANGQAGARSRHQPRYLADSGRLFFNSAGALVPQDSNGTQDVYQYEPAGVGDCSTSDPTYSARSEGCVALISSGRSTQESAFLDASESGDDVFFLTAAELSPIDVDAALDVYDAHVCSTAEPCISYASTQPPPCTSEASCKASPTPQPSIFGAPASATFSGAGNLTAPVVKPKSAEELRAEKLAKALKACRAKKNKQKRQSCEKQARKRYGTKAKAKAKAKGKSKAKKKGAKAKHARRSQKSSGRGK